MAEPIAVLVILAVAVISARWALADVRTVPQSADRRDTADDVSVVIPARNEERSLPALLASLRLLDRPLGEVVVVDDGSEDGTATVARSGGATVLQAGAPPRGWTGKAWACHRGAGATRGGLLLFLDADTVLSPHAVGALLDLHRQQGGLVSVQPFHDVRLAYEQLSAYFNIVSLMASGAFTSRPMPTPMAFGPCLLTSRADYERAGGHAVVRSEILDDVRLAQAYDRAGLKVHTVLGGAAIRMRSYPGGLRQLAAGWTKNFASGASAAALGPSSAVVLWVSAHHAVAAGGAVSLFESATGVGSSLAFGHPAVWAVGWLTVSWQLRSLLRKVGSFRWWTWIAFPVPLLAFDVLFARSAALTLVRRSVPWRGRPVDLGHRGSAREGS